MAAATQCQKCLAWTYLTHICPLDSPSTSCDCFRDPHAFYCATVTRDLVPGYHQSADGKADAAEQARWDRK